MVGFGGSEEGFDSLEANACIRTSDHHDSLGRHLEEVWGLSLRVGEENEEGKNMALELLYL